MKDIIANIEQKNKEIKSLKNQIDAKQKVIKDLIEENNLIKISLLEHYHQIFKEGKDTRYKN